MDLIKYLLSPKSPEYSWFTVILCRWRGHPCGPVWYNPGGLEPNMYCRDCGEDLG